MKTVRLLVVAFVLVTLLAACGGDAPSQAARQWLKAASSGDGATALKLTCNQYRQDVQTSGFLTAALGVLTGIDTQSAKVDISQLKFQTTSQSGSTATVHVQGELIVSLLGAAMPQELDNDLQMVNENGAWRVCSGF